MIAILATVTATVLAIPLGTIAAIKQDTWIDYVVRTFSIAGIAMPSFWFGILIIFGHPVHDPMVDRRALDAADPIQIELDQLGQHLQQSRC